MLYAQAVDRHCHRSGGNGLATSFTIVIETENQPRVVLPRLAGLKGFANGMQHHTPDAHTCCGGAVWRAIMNVEQEHS